MKPLVILSEYFPPSYMATGQLLEELSESLARNNQIEIVTSISSDNWPDNAKPYLVKRLTFQRRNKKSKAGRALNGIIYFTRTFFYLLFHRKGSLLLIVSNPPFMAFCGSLLNILRRQQFIYLIHDQYPEIAINLGYLKPGSLLVRFWKRLNRSIFKRAWKIITLGDRMQETIAALYPDTPFKKKAITLPNWSRSETIFPMPKLPLKAERGLKNKFVVQYSGNHGLFHGLEVIIEAAELLNETQDIHFMFVGDGGKKRDLCKRSEEMGLTNVSFFDYVPIEQLGSSLNCADIALVTLDRRADNLAVPSKFYGCLAAALPVIGMLTPGTDIANDIEKNGIGFVIDSSDPVKLAEIILQYYNNKSLCKEHSKKSRALFEKEYDLPVIAGKYAELLFSDESKKIIDKHR